MTARTHETIRVGLRRIIRDDGVSPKARMDAIKMLIKVEELLGHIWQQLTHGAGFKTNDLHCAPRLRTTSPFLGL